MFESILLILSAFFFATALLSNQIIAQEIPPGTATFLRFFIASIPMVIYNLVRSVNLKIEKKDFFYLMFLSFMGYTINGILFTVAMKSSSAINGSIISSSVPIFTLLLSVIFLNKKISFLNVCAIIISLFGVLSMILDWDFSQLFVLGSKGDILFVLGVLASCIYIVGVQSLLKKYDTFVIVMYMFILSFLTAIPFVIPELIVYNIMDTSTEVWIAVLVYGFFGAAVALSLQQICIRHFGSIVAALAINLVPIFVAICSYFLFGTIISLKNIVSMMIVISGVVGNILLTTPNTDSVKAVNDL